MKINFLLLTIITAVISSCSTSYKTGQTPDDVYYSPARLQTYEVKRDREENNAVDNTVYTTSEDRETRRRINNRRYRRYDRYDRYDYPYGYNNYPYGYYYNYPPVYGNPKYGTTQNTQQPRKTNLGAYTPNKTDSSNLLNAKSGKLNPGSPVRTFSNPGASSNNKSGFGNAIRRIFSGDNSSTNYNKSYNNTNNYNRYNSNNSNNSNSSPSRSFDRSSNNNNSGNSNTNSSASDNKSSSTSAPVRTFGKQN